MCDCSLHVTMYSHVRWYLCNETLLTYLITCKTSNMSNLYGLNDLPIQLPELKGVLPILNIKDCWKYETSKLVRSATKT